MRKFRGPLKGGWDALRRWAEATGEAGTGEFRELYLDCDGPRTSWVVEVQMALSLRSRGPGGVPQ